MSVTRNKRCCSLLKSSQTLSVHPDTRLDISSSSGFLPLSLTGLLQVLNKSLCGSLSPASLSLSWTPNLFILMNLSFITCRDASALPAAASYNALRSWYTSLPCIEPTEQITQCQERHAERGRQQRQIGNLCILLSRSSCLFVESPKEQVRKKRMFLQLNILYNTAKKHKVRRVGRHRDCVYVLEIEKEVQ